MRLTLRTLLAYLDDVLESSDAQDIGKKIEESEFAANIVHKTRDVMRRLRLGAPRLSGRGMGLDPNTVGEYLDNNLADDRVAEFERVCLESDVHLAEVASCHQILVRVLGEAADVDPRVRERMYALVEQAQPKERAAVPAPEPAPQPSPPAPAKQPIDGRPPAAAPQPVRPRRKAEVPSYLRQPEMERSWRKPAAVLALIGCLAVVLLMAIDGSWLADKLGLGPRRPAPTTPQAVASNGGSPNSVVEADASAENTEPKTPSTTELKQPESVSRTTPEAAATSPRATPEEPPEPKRTPEPTAETPAKPVENAKPAEVATKPAEAAKPADTAPAPATPPAAKPEPAPARPAAMGNNVGRLVSTNEVLLRSDAQSNGWQRVPVQDMVSAGQQLIALPAFRPTITLINGVTLEMLGGTSVQLHPIGEDGVPAIGLDFGRIVILTPGRPDSRLKLAAGDRRLQVAFGDVGASMALEVRPKREDGADPEAAPPQLQIALYVATGKLSVVDAAANQSRDVEGPAVVALGAVPVPGDALPDWISMDQPSPAEKIAAQFITERLTTDRLALLGLKELAEPDSMAGRRTEVRTLAAKSLAVLDDFDSLVGALNRTDPNFRTIWNELITELRSAIARGPATAAKVRESFERQRGDHATDLYRMLWGYSLADLRSDSKPLKQLVDYLDSPDMDYRALAFWNLRDLTNATLFYQPSMTAEARKPYVLKWRQRLESNQILPKVD